MSSERVEKIRAVLNTALAPESLEIIDDSHKHAGHAGAKAGGGHFTVQIVASAFDGMNTLARHRLIYESLGDLMQTEIHALSIQAVASNEV